MKPADVTTFGAVEQLLPEALMLVDGDGRVLDANPAACRVFGAGVENLRSGRLFELVKTDGDGILTYLRSCSGSRQFVLGAVTIESDGRDVTYRCEGAVVRPAAGDLRAIVLIRLRPRETTGSRFKLLSAKVDELEREIVSRMRAESLLEAQRRVLELVARGAPLDRTLDELTRATEDQSPGDQRVSILLLDDDGRHLRDGAGDRLPAAYRQAIDGVEIGPSVGSCGTAAHENRPIIASDIATDPRWENYRDLALAHGLRACWSTPIPARDGSVLGTFALYYDEPRAPGPGDQRAVETMTRIASIAIERKRVERQVRLLLDSERAARAEAETANRSKDEFLALVSHELRNPLNAIVGWVQLLQQGDLDPATRARATETIDRNARLQSELISDVLDFARITSGRLTLELEPVSLHSVVDKACESVRPETTNRGLSLDISVDLPDTPVSLDPNRLQQAVSNILWNAIKFTPRGGRISVRLFREGDLTRISISDTGCGIEPEFLPSVFERFRQGEAGLARKHGGLGLGLAIVRHIVELHGGRVQAESAGPDKGSTFTLSLPLNPSRTSARPDPKTTRLEGLAGLHVLAVDDVADARDLLEAALSRAGARVSLAGSAGEALDLLQRDRPDVVVCDIGMPGMDGFELMRTFRAGEKSERLPAIALTAYSRDVDRRRAFEAGFDRHVSKPLDAPRLVETIAELTRSRHG